MQENYHGAVFWIEVDKIRPNPYQPRREFNEDRLRDLADSIRQYGVLMPIAVTRQEVFNDDGSMKVEYELIAGERRWRASQLAGLSTIPAVIRSGEDTDKMKLEMAIIENLQREDLNPVDRAQAFERLAKEFNLRHVDIAKKVGKSREYVSNSVRILALPIEIRDALVAGKITEGHTRPILMLVDRPQEQLTLFQEIINKRLTVREAEGIARRIAFERVRKKDTFVDPEIVEMEEKLTEKLGTRVKVEKRDTGGRVMIEFFSATDLHKILDLLAAKQVEGVAIEALMSGLPGDTPALLVDDKPAAEKEDLPDEELYNIKNFSL